MPASEEDLIARLRVAGVQAFRSGMRSAASSVSEVGSRAKLAESRLHVMERAGQKTVGQLRGLATGAAFAGVAIGAGIVKATVDFDRGMRNVNSIAQLSEGQLQSLSKRVLGLAGQTGQAPKTLAAGLYDLVSSGFSANESFHILTKSARAASAGLTDTATSTKAVAAILNAYHLPAAKAGKVSDQLFQIVNRGVISFGELSSTIGDVLPFAASLGIGLDQVGASIATMTKAGINPFETMTRIKTVMEALIKPSQDMTKTLTKLGYSSGQSIVKHKGLQGALMLLAKTTGGSKEQMAKLFPNIRALGGALALTGKNSKGAAADLKGMEDTSGATAKALSQQSKSVSYQWDRLKATATELGITVGSKLIPKMRNAVTDIRRFVTGMIDGKGAGGRFAASLSNIWHKAEPVLKFLKDNPRLIAVAAGAWAAYKTATLVALGLIRVAQFRAAFMRSVPAAAEAGTAAGTTFAASETAASRAGLAASAGSTGLLAAAGVLGTALGVAMAAAFVLVYRKQIIQALQDAKTWGQRNLPDWITGGPDTLTPQMHGQFPRGGGPGNGNSPGAQTLRGSGPPLPGGFPFRTGTSGRAPGQPHGFQSIGARPGPAPRGRGRDLVIHVHSHLGGREVSRGIARVATRDIAGR